MLSIVRLVLRGRQVVPDFAISSCSASLLETCAMDLVHFSVERNAAPRRDRRLRQTT